MTKMVLGSSFSTILAQASAPAGAPAGAGFGMWTLIMYGCMFVGIYFLMIAPQRKKQKEMEKMLAALQSGDEVITTGGIYGTITNVKEDRFVVRIADNTKIELAKGDIRTVTSRSGDEKK